MNETRLAGRVGAFMVMAIILVAVLLLVFSKGMTWFTPTYTLRLRADNVGGLKSRSAVLISGVAVGTVVNLRTLVSNSVGTQTTAPRTITLGPPIV